MLAFFLKSKKWFRDRIEYVKIVKIWIVWKNYNTCTHLIQKSETLNSNLIRQSISKSTDRFWFGIMVNKFVFRLIKLCFPVFSFSPYNFSTSSSSSEVTIDRKAKKKKPTFFLDWRLSVYCKITTSLKDYMIFIDYKFFKELADPFI